MKDDISREFQEFSDTLDQDETREISSGDSLGEERELLLELRRQLRDGTASLELPKGFAKSTAQVVATRFHALPSSTRFLLSLEPSVCCNAFSPQSMPWLFGTVLLGIGALAFSWEALFGLGVLVLVLGLPLLLFFRPSLELNVPKELQEKSSPFLRGLFCFIPTLAVIATAGLAGRLITALGSMSLSFQSNGLAIAAGSSAIVVLAWLCNALYPLWSACEKASRGRPLWTFAIQALHGGWLLAVIIILSNQMDSAQHLRALFQWSCLSSVTIVTALLFYRTPVEKSVPLRPVFRRSLASFLVGALPLIAMLILFYQAGLTREIAFPQEYQEMRKEAQAWLSQQRSIPTHENGVTELKEILYAHQDEPTEAWKIAERLKGGGNLYWKNFQGSDTSSKEWKTRQDKFRREFLQELPRIESALAKPSFSPYAYGDFNLTSRAPNYILCRAVSQALEALVEESLDKEEVDLAIKYMTLNLTWADGFSNGLLIDLMVGVAMKQIASESLERLLHENELSEAQLLKLSQTLEKTTSARDSFRQTMLRDIYLIDQGFFELRAQEDNFLKAPALDDPVSWAKLFPHSYWESERKVYMNLQLSQLPDWTELARPTKFDDPKLTALLPWSFTAREIAPHSMRAQANFMVLLSYFTALRTEVALELYRHHHGDYPSALEKLVPDYLDAVPIDAAHPHLWRRKTPFTYKYKASGYDLISESPVYEIVGLKPTQVYGPHGSWTESRKR